MKKCYILFLCLFGISNLTFAQHKSEFGLVLKAGNYGFPVKKKPGISYADFETNYTNLKPGRSLTFGLWYAYQLNPQFSIEGELLYRNIVVSGESEHFFVFSDGITTKFAHNYFSERVSESSVVLPIQLRFRPKRAKKWSFYAGAGIAKAFSASFKNEYRSMGIINPDFELSTSRKLGADAFSMNIQYNAGLSFQLDPKTSIGLAYAHELFDENYIEILNLTTPFIFCSCDYNSWRFRGNLNSITFTLRHNLLR